MSQKLPAPANENVREWSPEDGFMICLCYNQHYLVRKDQAGYHWIMCDKCEQQHPIAILD